MCKKGQTTGVHTAADWAEAHFEIICFCRFLLWPFMPTLLWRSQMLLEDSWATRGKDELLGLLFAGPCMLQIDVAIITFDLGSCWRSVDPILSSTFSFPRFSCSLLPFILPLVIFYPTSLALYSSRYPLNLLRRVAVSPYYLKPRQ